MLKARSAASMPISNKPLHKNSAMKKLMIYGAAGYTGGMAAEHAASLGLPLVLAGRDKDHAALDELAGRLGAGIQIFSQESSSTIERNLAGVSALLNTAGPFNNTAKPLMSAAIRAGVHYLDFSAEIDTYQQALALDGQARAAGVMLLPGSGGSVAMLGGLAAHAVARIPDARKISIALNVTGTMSRGSATTANQNIVTQTLRLIDGELAAWNPGNVRDFDFGQGPQSSFPVALPDLLTIQHATGVADIETFVHITAGSFPTGDINDLRIGPSAEERQANRYQAAIEVIGLGGMTVRSLLDTVNGYTFTAMAAAEAARRVLDGVVQPGFQTPAGLFGRGFVEAIADTQIIDITDKGTAD